MPDRSTLILLYDGTFEGLLTAVFDSYSFTPPPQSIDTAELYQPQLGCRYKEITADKQKAARVITGVRREMGTLGYRKIWQAFLHADGDKATAIYRYVRLGMKEGERIHRLLTHPVVMAVDKLCALTGREAGFLTEFIRFSELEGHVYYAEITPEHFALALIMPHFAARMNTHPFLIHDKTHGIAGIYDRRGWYLVSTEGMTVPALSENEVEYRRLWKGFYDAIAIKERLNPSLRRQLMPKKYWKNITELQPDFVRAPSSLRTATATAEIERDHADDSALPPAPPHPA